MKNFSFRLERVLQLRMTAEQAQARRVADARQDEATSRRQADEAAARVAEAIDQMAATPAALSTAGNLGNVMLVLESARARSAAAAVAHREASARLEIELLSFEQARQARRAIEKLREQRYAQWQTETGRTDQQLTDEVALRRPRSQWVAG
jgi:flagellar export protein FliJ